MGSKITIQNRMNVILIPTVMVADVGVVAVRCAISFRATAGVSAGVASASTMNAVIKSTGEV